MLQCSQMVNVPRERDEERDFVDELVGLEGLRMSPYVAVQKMKGRGWSGSSPFHPKIYKQLKEN